MQCTLSSGSLYHVYNSVCRRRSAQTVTCLHALCPQMLMTGCMCLLQSLSPCMLCHPLKASVLHPMHDTWMNGAAPHSCDPVGKAMHTISNLSRLNNSNRHASLMFQLCIALRSVINLFLAITTLIGRTHVASCYNTNSRVSERGIKLATSCHHDLRHDVCRLKPHSQGSYADSRAHKHHSQSKTDVCSLSTAAQHQAPGLLSRL